MTIIIASGGTLGHLMPIVPVVDRLKARKRPPKIILFTTKKQVIPEIIKSLKIDDIIYFEAQGMSKNIFKVIVKNKIVLKQLKKAITKFSPELIIGMGGYISGLATYVGKQLKYPVLIHEQNSVMGKANKWIMPKVDALIYSYPELNIKTKYLKKSYFLINPRLEYANLEQRFYQEKKDTILIVSGSLGATKINEIAVKLAESNFKITLITGEKYYQKFQQYQSPTLNIVASTTNLIKLIASHEIVISRAGATTIAEIIGCNTLGIYIPSPNVTNNHQVKNANFIVENELGKVINEKDLSPQILITAITELRNKSVTIKNNLSNYSKQKAISRYCEIIDKVGKNDFNL